MQRSESRHWLRDADVPVTLKKRVPYKHTVSTTTLNTTAAAGEESLVIMIMTLIMIPSGSHHPSPSPNSKPFPPTSPAMGLVC